MLTAVLRACREANGRGYWDTSEENIERLKELYLQCEDKLEGVE